MNAKTRATAEELAKGYEAEHGARTGTYSSGQTSLKASLTRPGKDR